MITDKEAIFLAERCFGYREAADLLKSQKSIVFKCNAAFQLAMCGENKIQIPKIVRMQLQYYLILLTSTT